MHQYFVELGGYRVELLGDKTKDKSESHPESVDYIPCPIIAFVLK